MTEKETEQTTELADIIVEKFRALVDLESRVLEAREFAVHNTTEPVDPQVDSIAGRQETLTKLEWQLKRAVEEMDIIMEELQFAPSDFRAYLLPQIGEIIGTLRACDAVEQGELIQLVDALVDVDSPQSLEQLEAIIITRLRDNLEKTFGI